MKKENFLKLKAGDKVRSIFQTTGEVVSTQFPRTDKVLIQWDDNNQSVEDLNSCATLKDLI